MNDDALKQTLTETISSLSGGAMVRVTESAGPFPHWEIAIEPSENTPQGNVQVGSVLGQISTLAGKRSVTLHPPAKPEAGGASIHIGEREALQFLDTQQTTQNYVARLQEETARLNEASRQRS